MFYAAGSRPSSTPATTTIVSAAVVIAAAITIAAIVIATRLRRGVCSRTITALVALRLASAPRRIRRLWTRAVFVAIALTDRRGDRLLRAQRARTIALIVWRVGQLRLRCAPWARAIAMILRRARGLRCA